MIAGGARACAVGAGSLGRGAPERDYSEPVPVRADTFDLEGLRLAAGEGRRLDVHVAVDPYLLGGERYQVQGTPVPARLEISRTTGPGYAIRLRFEATLAGPCMRCLEPAARRCEVDAREVSQVAREVAEPGAADELASPYVEHGALDLRAWARDALALALPPKLLCRDECAGLCPVCGTDLNAAGSEHRHEGERDPRWAKLSELRLE